MRPTGMKICACLLLIVLKALCLCFLTQSSAAIDVGTSEDTSVSYPRNSSTTLAGSQNNGADNYTNAVEVIDLCTNPIPPTFDGKIYDREIEFFYSDSSNINLCQGHSKELIQGKHWI